MEDFQDPTRYLKTAKRVYQYDEASAPIGVAHDVYYDRKVGDFIIADFPTAGHTFEVSQLPDGFADLGIDNENYKVRVYEV